MLNKFLNQLQKLSKIPVKKYLNRLNLEKKAISELKDVAIVAK